MSKWNFPFQILHCDLHKFFHLSIEKSLPNVNYFVFEILLVIRNSCDNFIH